MQVDDLEHVAEPIRAYRMFSMDDLDDGHGDWALLGARGYRWLERSITAYCETTLLPSRYCFLDPRVQRLNHGTGPCCGLYALATASDAVMAWPNQILAEVSLSGVVRVCEYGYVAEKMRLERLRSMNDPTLFPLETSVIRALERRYGVTIDTDTGGIGVSLW